MPSLFPLSHPGGWVFTGSRAGEAVRRNECAVLGDADPNRGPGRLLRKIETSVPDVSEGARPGAGRDRKVYAIVSGIERRSGVKTFCSVPVLASILFLLFSAIPVHGDSSVLSGIDPPKQSSNDGKAFDGNYMPGSPTAQYDGTMPGMPWPGVPSPDMPLPGMPGSDEPIPGMPQPAEPGQAPRPKVSTRSFLPDPVIMVKFTETRERAFSVLIPKGWMTEGGIMYLDPNTAGGPTNAVGPKINFAVKSDAQGTVMLYWFPDFYYCDMRSSTTRQYGLFPDGSNYNGMVVMPCMSARDFLLRKAFPEVRPNARNVQVVDARPLPGVARQFAAASPVQGFQYDAAMVTLTYLENGVRFQEQIFGVIENLGQVGAGMWQNKSVVFARAPADQYDEWAKIGSLIYFSVKVNPRWLAAAMRATDERARLAWDTQRYIQEVDAAIVAHRNRVNAEIRHSGYLLLTGQEDYINPYTGETEIRPDGWRHHWQNSAGEVVVSNNDDYDPNHDPHRGRSDYKRSPVRPR